MDTFNYHVNDNGALGRKTRVPTWFRAEVEQTAMPPPMTREEVFSVRARAV